MKRIQPRAHILAFSHQRRRLLAPAAAVSLFAALSGCSTEDSASPGANASTYENLTTDLSICDQAQRDCLDAADGDRPKIQVCHDEMSGCRDAVKAAKKEIHASLRACVDTARACVKNIGDGGRDARRACGTQFHQCVQEALPPPPPVPPCVQALHACLGENEDGGRDAKRECFQQFRTCAEANLPPCLKGLAQCLDAQGDMRACQKEERECRDYRLSHDGGVPPSP
jgi:hypothetical protein